MERESEKIRKKVKERYGDIASNLENITQSGCEASCCGSSTWDPKTNAEALGYSLVDIQDSPEGANMGLGCGNPNAIASLRPGETVLDLGCGGGFDCFIASKAVGEKGRVIGVDMTPEMLKRARENAEKAGITNVEFKQGQIEKIPMKDNSIDVIMSNCVINLSPEKDKVYQDSFRVLKPGGRLAISDIVATIPLPEEMRKDMNLVSSCIGGAETIDNIKEMLEKAGFQTIKIIPNEKSRQMIKKWMPGSKVDEYIVSAVIEAIKPKA